MNQMDLALARAEGVAGMERAESHAERVSPGIAEAMYLYLLRYAQQCERGDRFTAEVVTLLYAKDGCLVQPPDSRSWGGVFVRAINRGIIAIADFNGVRTLGHGTKGAKRYRSLVSGKRWSEVAP